MRLRFDRTDHTSPKRIVKRMAESTSLLDWPIDFRSVVSTHLDSGAKSIVHVTKMHLLTLQ